MSAVDRLVELGIEHKDIRRVRTPGGVEHFDQPIGTIIVPDIPGEVPNAAQPAMHPLAKRKGPTGILKKSKTSPYEGWDEYTDGDTKIYVGKFDPKQWVAVNEEDEPLTDFYGKKPEAVEAMKEMYEEAVSEDEVQQFPRRITAAGKYKKRPSKETIKRDKLREVRTERELRDIQASWPKGKTIPPTAVNVWVSDDPDAEGVQNYATYTQVGGKSDGKIQIVQTEKTEKTNEGKKYGRVGELAENIHKVDKKLTPAAVKTDDVMAAVALMRLLGARVGSSSAKDAEDGRGITQIRAEDVTFSESGNAVTMEWVGKMGSTQHYETGDPLIVGLIKARMKKAKGPKSELLPGATSAKTIKRARELTGMPNVKNHDFRTLFATEQAEILMGLSKYKGGPKNEKQMKEWMESIGATVDEMLNDKDGQALKSYISPRIWDDWYTQIQKDV